MYSSLSVARDHNHLHCLCTRPGSMPVMRPNGDWTQLPRNLWADIFGINLPYSTSDSLCSLELQAIKLQSDFFKLRMVCQTFNNIFQQHGRLSSSVVIRHGGQNSQLPSLLNWMRCHLAHVRLLDVHHDSPWQEMALTALLSPHACLEQVYFRSAVKDTVLFPLSTFKSITTCTLVSNVGNSLNLQPLSSLPLLTTLTLRFGNFVGLEAAAHLTSLLLAAAEVVCAEECSCVTSLVELKLFSAKLLYFHSRNVAACLGLKSLVLHSATISGHTLDEGFMFPDGEDGSIPTGLSAMTALTSLELNYPAHAMQLFWLTALSALQSFVLDGSYAEFSASFSFMTSLKTLKICLETDRTCNLVFQFDLRSLASLQRFELRFVTMHAKKLSGLALLPDLQEVYLENVTPYDLVTATAIGVLAFELGRRRQAVQFSMFSHDFPKLREPGFT